MTQNEVKPGTRCGCRDAACHGSGRNFLPVAACHADAVRMVTVPYPQAKYPNGTCDVMMCAPCAAFHESKAATK